MSVVTPCVQALLASAAALLVTEGLPWLLLEMVENETALEIGLLEETSSVDNDWSVGELEEPTGMRRVELEKDDREFDARSLLESSAVDELDVLAPDSPAAVEFDKGIEELTLAVDENVVDVDVTEEPPDVTGLVEYMDEAEATEKPDVAIEDRVVIEDRLYWLRSQFP